MTLLVLAPRTDETARRFARFADGHGVPAVVADGFGRVQVTVHATRERVCRTRFTVDGTEVRAILVRGVTDWGHEPDAERAFVRAETYAAFWSAVALWPGPVVNRPSARGFFPRMDPLELAASGAVAPPRTVILNDGTAPGDDVYRISDWTTMAPGAPRSRFDVVRIDDRHPAGAHRILVAGTAVFELTGSGAGQLLEPALVRRLSPVLDWLARNGMDFADFTVEREGGVPRLVDVSCLPGHHLFADIEDRVHAALLDRLVP
jgi:hypothetical protein